jgi:outer membrane lipoprotein-sorting protein
MNKTVRWLPAILAPALVVAGAIAIPTAANAAPVLQQKTAQQVLAMIVGAKDAAYSGMIAQSSNLGLPQLPSIGAGSANSGSDMTSTILDLLTADHNARVYVGGASKERLQVLDRLAERDVIRNGSTVWTYNSKTKAATKFTLPSHNGSAATPPATPPATPSTAVLTPAQLADKAIASIEPTTTVQVITTARVASRPVYQIELTPKANATLVSHVVLSVDAATGLPLKVVVDARGQKGDAFSLGFSTIDFSTPAASLFDFTPPSDATVSTPKAWVRPGHVGQNPDATTPATPVKPVRPAKPTIKGTGWDSIVELPAKTSGSKMPGSVRQSKLLDELTTTVPGGRALQTSLLSVLLLDDGRILVGAVPIASLEAAAQ